MSHLLVDALSVAMLGAWALAPSSGSAQDGDRDGGVPPVDDAGAGAAPSDDADRPGDPSAPDPDDESEGRAEEPVAPAEGAGDDAARAREEAEVAAELAAIGGDEESAESPEPPADGSGTAASRGLSNLMNPAISAVGIVLGGYSSREEPALVFPGDLSTGINVQEIEIRASAVVDPYFRADITLSGSLEGVAFEEGFVSTLEIPSVTLRLGQMIASFGRHNLLHTHAFPFLTAPLPLRVLLGDEGLRDPGVSADILLPLPFFAELNVQIFAGDWAAFEGSIEDDPSTAVNEAVPDRRELGDLAYAGHLKTLFELGDSTTIELGASFVGGRNGFGGFTAVAGGDVTLKWRPIEAERYLAFDWTTEYVWVGRENAPEDDSVGGAYTALRLMLAQQWWVQLRGAALGLPEGAAGRTWRAEALGAFIPSEFSALRLQYAIEVPETGPAPIVHEVFAQFVFSIGPHPAHAY